jgi:hypothetical protein
MENINLRTIKLLYNCIENVSIEIDAHKERYEKCKKEFLAADAKLKKAIAEDDTAAKFEAAFEIIPIVNALHETRERIKQLTSKLQGLYKQLMDHQKSDEHDQKSDKHVYVLPRQQVIEFLDAIEEEVDENPDFKTITLAINTSLLKK